MQRFGRLRMFTFKEQERISGSQKILPPWSPKYKPSYSHQIFKFNLERVFWGFSDSAIEDIAFNEIFPLLSSPKNHTGLSWRLGEWLAFLLDTKVCDNYLRTIICKGFPIELWPSFAVKFHYFPLKVAIQQHRYGEAEMKSEIANWLRKSLITLVPLHVTLNQSTQVCTSLSIRVRATRRLKWRGLQFSRSVSEITCHGLESGSLNTQKSLSCVILAKGIRRTLYWPASINFLVVLCMKN